MDKFWLPSSNVNSNAEDQVPIGTLEKIADTYAHDLWGKNIARGHPIPAINEVGELTIYIFPYIRNSDHFPEYDNIFNVVRDLRLKHRNEIAECDRQEAVASRQTSDSYAELERQFGQFGSIYVSATRKDFPIIGAIYALHPYFLLGEVAQEEAEHHFGRNDVKLESIYFLGPHAEYLNFSAGNERILLNMRTLERKVPGDILATRKKEILPDSIKTEIKQLWSDMEKPQVGSTYSAGATISKLINNWNLIPVVNWTWWCVPTAATMVMGYWDNYVNGIGTNLGFGRLISHWYNHPNPKFAGNNVPSFIDELIDPTTGNWRAGFKDFPDFIKKTYGYTFKREEFAANANNDWAWSTLVNEINANRPVLWGMSDPNHAVAAFGYHINNGKYVVAYNTWGQHPEDPSDQSQKSEWIYTKCDGMTAHIPITGDGGENIATISPNGGEILYTYVPLEISWFVWGNSIKKTSILFSIDGGNSWSTVANDIITTQGINSYSWRSNIATSNGRVRVKGYDNIGQYIAGDGSHRNFSINSSQISNLAGKINFLRAHDLGTGYGPANDYLDAEVVLHLNSNPNTTLGFQLRQGQFLPEHRKMLSILQNAFYQDITVSIDYVKVAPTKGVILRTWMIK
jgi:hypothetical protein